MSEYTQGVCHDGAAILKDGQPLTIEQVIEALRERDALAAHVDRITGLCRDLDECELGSKGMADVWNDIQDACLERPSTSLAHRDARIKQEAIEQVANDFKEAWPEHNGKYYWLVGASFRHRKETEAQQ